MISDVENNYTFETLDLLSQIQVNFPRIEFKKIEELKQLDPTLEVFSKLVHIFYVEVSGRIPEMKNYCDSHNYENLSRVIHRFKSTAYNLGASRAVEFMAHIEKVILRAGRELEIKLWIMALEKECHETYQNLLKLNR